MTTNKNAALDKAGNAVTRQGFVFDLCIVLIAYPLLIWGVVEGVTGIVNHATIRERGASQWEWTDRETLRLRVPGGWLVRTRYHGQGPVFVADSEHEWDVTK